MQKIKINGKNYSLQDSAADFLKKYLERLREYTHDKKIDLELYQDIEERIAEKIDVLGKKVSQKDVVDIVNSLGEPEEIFSDYEGEEIPVIDKITQNGENFFKIVKENAIKAVSYSKNKFKEIKKKIDDEKVVEKVKKKSKTVFQNIKSKTTEKKEKADQTQTKTEQKIEVEQSQVQVEVKTQNKTGGFFSVIGRIIHNFFAFIFGLIATIIVFSIKLIIWCFNFIFFSIFGIIFFAIVLVLLFVAPLTYVNVVIANQEVFAYIPRMTQWSFIILFVSSSILMASSINSALRQKWVPRFLSFLATIAFFIGMFGTLIGVYTVANEYTNEYTESYVFDFPEYENEEIVLEDFYYLHRFKNENLFDFDLPPGHTYLELKQSTDNNLRFEITTSIRAQNETKAQKILDELVPVEITQNENTFNLSLTEENIFRNVVPFSILHYKIKIFVPENVKVNLNKNSWNYVRNAEVYKKIGRHDYKRCSNPLIYNAEKEKFICSESGSGTLLETSTGSKVTIEEKLTETAIVEINTGSKVITSSGIEMI